MSPSRADQERLSLDDPALVRLKASLARANYSEQGIAALGIDVGLGVREPDVPVLLRALRPMEPLATLVRFFLLGRELRLSELERGAGLAVEGLARLGFLDRRGDRVRPKLRLTPWAGMLVAHDPDPHGALWPDHVTGPNPAADTLARLTVRAPVRSALDMGTGSGLFALLAARHAERVVASDVNTRALRYAAINAALNELSNVETREGSFFEPVADDRFELIVSNPPFVISPETVHVFRFSGLPRDEVSRRVVRGAAAHLEEGGFAHLLLNWIQPPGADPGATLLEWLADSGCDGLLLHHGTEDPLAYAVRWNLRLQHLDPAAYPETLDRWLAYYRKEGIQAIGSGALTLRRRTGGPAWFHTLQVGLDPPTDAGGHVRAMVAAQDYLAQLNDDRAMLRDAFSLGDRHRLDQALVFRGDRYAIQAASLVLQDGVGVRALIDPELMGLLFRLDGSRPLGDITAEVAAETEAEPGTMEERGLTLVRTLLDFGLANPIPLGGLAE